MTRAERLRAYVDAAQTEPLVWGKSDCSAWPAAWVAQETGRKVPLPPYGSRADAHAIIGKAGGLVNVWSAMAQQVGLLTTPQPVLGDVGVVALSDRDIGGIFAHDGILYVRTDAGRVIGLRPKKILAAWSL